LLIPSRRHRDRLRDLVQLTPLVDNGRPIDGHIGREPAQTVEQKITEQEMLTRFEPGAVLLAPLIVRSHKFKENRGKFEIDALLEVALPGGDDTFQFVVESKSRSTPEAVHGAAAKAMATVQGDEWPMIQVPYLGPDRLEYLERLGVSGVDLCGNGVVVIPDRLYVIRTGQPNNYRDSRPLNNPFRGRSAMVARTLLTEPTWPNLSKMVHWIEHAGASLSLAQASKAIRGHVFDYQSDRLWRSH
jgi:hypothetical protein